MGYRLIVLMLLLSCNLAKAQHPAIILMQENLVFENDIELKASESITLKPGFWNRSDGNCLRLFIAPSTGGPSEVKCKEGTPCDDGDPCTYNDKYDSECICKGHN